MINSETLAQEFRKQFSADPRWIARAPGRINLIGEHVDYNGGFVLPAAIDFEIKMAAAPAPDDRMQLHSVNYGSACEFDVARELPRPEKVEWYSYFLAVCDQFRQRGISLPALQVCISGDVPAGSGLSSSAAFEVCTATLLNEVTDAKIHKRDIALLAQAAEHSAFVGVKCGIMDQFASALGQANSALLLDCHTLEFQEIPFDSSGASIVIINTNKPRELRSSEYNQRRRECELGLARINELSGQNFASLRHVPADVAAQFEPSLDPVVAQRVRHNIGENQRVLAFVDALRGSDWNRAGELLYASHQSLRDDFEVSCAELDAIVEIARESGLVYGCRMTGGGFGGCAVALTAPSHAEAFRKIIHQEYPRRTGLKADVYVTAPSDGAGMQETVSTCRTSTNSAGE